MATVSCPTCGGTSSRALAPNYVECTSQVLRNVIPAGAQGNPVDVPLYGSCGHRFQTGPSPAGAAQCTCGMFAVGRCTTCDQPLCGDHVDRYAGQVMCEAHAAALRTSDRRRDEQAAADLAVLTGQVG